MVKGNGGAAGLASNPGAFATMGDCGATDCSFAQKL